MRFVSQSGNKRVQILCNKANALIQDRRLYHALEKVRGFRDEFTSSPDVTGKYLWSRLLTDPSMIEVKLFTSKNPWTSSNGYTLQDDLTQIFLNTRKMGRSDASILATLFHEAIHELDNNDPAYFYHHGDNTPKGGTAPEVIADVVYELESGTLSTADSSIRERKKSRPWWRLWA